MDNVRKLKGRYELKETLGKGGMGVVYRAYDGVLKCDVAVKTLRAAPDAMELQLFYRECEVLVALNHPNIVQILDMGEFEEEGESKPYFVMPLLPGMSLDRLIRDSGAQLTVQRRVEILSQVCRGLHAAHERGLVHRDIKPGNVFVMPDFSAEIIDFGIAHMLNAGATGQKGTLLYMAPELIEGKPPSPLSDIFALGAMAYELFTRRRPFDRPTEREIIEAILHESPPPASDLDTSVNQALSRVLHKSLAKQPWHRFSTARDFADCLEKAYRGEAIEYFDSARILPRIQRAKTAFEQGDHQFAMEIVGELEAEGHLDPDVTLLHHQIDIAVRQKRIRQLVESARSRMEGEEYPLALQKVQEILSLEPDHAEALSLKSKIESARSEGQIEGWFRLARQHIDNNAFAHAREALQNVLQIRPQDTRASGLLAEVRRKEQEYLRLRQEKEQLYQLAVEAYQKGDVSAALTKLERLLEMERRAPDSTQQDRGNVYQNLFNQVRSEHDAIQNAYAEARKHLADQNFARTLAICDECLQKYPGHALFQSLKFDAQEHQRLQLSTYIAEVDRRVEGETDLERKVNIIREALDRFPDEPHFERLLRIMRERLNLVSGIVAKARYHEERGQFTEALGQWEILRTIHAKYPGLQFEIERVTKRRDQQGRTESKARWAQQIDAQLEAGEYERALETARSALEEFPGDGELGPLEQLAMQGRERCAEASRLHAEGERLFDSGAFDEGLEALQRAYELDKRNDAIRISFANRLVGLAQKRVETDWRAAEVLVQRGLSLDPSHAGAKGVSLLLEDLRREDFLNQAISRIRQHQASGDAKNALAELEQALSFYPGEPRLLQLRPSLENKVKESDRHRDLEQIRGLAAGVGFVSDAADIRSILELMKAMASHYPGDREFQAATEEVEQKLKTATKLQPPGPPQATAGTGTLPQARPQPEAPAVPPFTAPAPPAPVVPVPPPPPPVISPPAAPPSAAKPEMSATQIFNAAAMRAALEGAGPSAPASPSPAVPPPAARPRVPPRMVAIAAGVIVLLAGAGLVLALLLRSGRARRPVEFEVQSTPSGATLHVNGKLVGTAGSRVQLVPGDYRVLVAKEGYRPELVPVTLKPGQSMPPIRVTLQPLPQQLKITSGLKGARYSLDGAAAADLPPSGQAAVDVAPGRHTLALQIGAGRASFAFETWPGALPRVEKPVVSGGIDAVITGVWKDRALVHSSFEKAPVRVGDRDAGQLGANGLELKDLAPGAHELRVGAGDQSWYGSMESGPEPVISAFLISTATAGTILVEVTGADGAHVLLDGADKGLTAGGHLRFSAEPGLHQIHVNKDGFLEAPARSVTVEKGKQANVAFVLAPRPTPVVEQPKAPRTLLGKVRIEVSPPSAQITYSRNGETHTASVGALQLVEGNYTPKTGQWENGIYAGELQLVEGNYTFSARAPGYVDKSVAVLVEAGGTKDVNLTLTPTPTPVNTRKAAPQPVVHAMKDGDWETPWSKDGEWFTRQGGNFVLYKVTPVAGTYQFTLRAKGSRFSGPKARWLACYVNERNYIVFELDKQSYSAAEYRDGKKSMHVNKKKLAAKSDVYVIRMTIEPDRLAVALLAEGSATLLDEWKRPSPPFTDGRFGFYFPGDTQMWLANFTFTEQKGQ
jgi:serine/threonine-protein kinase